MTRLALDTSAYSQFRRGHDQIVDLLDGAREVLVATIVIGELRAGFRAGKRTADNERHLLRFLQQPAVRVLDVDDAAATCYADIWTTLRTAGTPIPTNDMWIAALALREGATIVTYDAHFAHVGAVGSLILSAEPPKA